MTVAVLRVYEPPPTTVDWLQPRGQLCFFLSDEYPDEVFDPHAPSINVCACGEPIPEEVGHCEECRDWGTSLQREAAYVERLRRRDDPWWWQAGEAKA